MTFPILPVTGNAAFDYFFTLCFAFGIISILPAMIFRLFKY